MNSHVLTQSELDRLITADTVVEQTVDNSGAQLLSLLASIDRELLAKLMSEQRFAAGEIVFQEGDSGDAMYLIWSGRVVIVKGDLQSPTILGYRNPGVVIGEMALLDSRPRSASAVALEDLRLLRVTREGFQQLLNSAPAIGMMIMEMLSVRLREADNVRATTTVASKRLVRQVSELQTEKQQLLELERLRQETSDLVIHDLRNPLGTIQGALKMLEVVLPPDILKENEELLSIVNSASGRMQRLVDSLLDVSKLETGEVHLQLSPTDLRSLVDEVVKRSSLILKDRKIDLQIIIQDLRPVLMDAERMDRVLSNLLDNAIKYTPKSGQLIIAAQAQPDYVVVSMTDNGPGIPPEERERIFERFAQVAGDRPAGARRGFGLGLAFCRLAVEAHGGEIWVEPGQDGAGSCFAFTLPLSQDK